MKLFVVLSLLLAGAVARSLPEHASGKHVDVPEDCHFVEASERVEGDLTIGEYSYLDPRGNLITVSWTDGPNGYQESRKVLRNFAGEETSSSSAVNQEQLIATIIKELQPVIVSTVQSTVGGSTKPAVAPVALLPAPIPERPVVTVEVEKPQVSSEAELIARIISVLRGQIVSLVQTAVSSEQKVVVPEPQVVVETKPVVDEQALIAKIVTQLRSVIVTQVEQALAAQQATVEVVTPAPAPAVDTEALIARVLAELQPFIARTVEAALAAQNTVSEEEFMSRVISVLNPQLSTIVRSAIVSVRGSALVGDEEQLVVLIISRLQPVIITTIRDVTVSESISYSEIFATEASFDAFMARIIERLRPLILEAVRVALPRPTTTTTTTTVAPQSLQEVFGVSGTNFVKFDSQNVRYGYMTD